MKIEEKAREYAELKHKGQKRRSLEPYINHPVRVAEIIKKHKKSHKINELISAALLHDTLEDTNTSEEELRRMFGELVTSLVKELTSDRKKSRDNKKQYLATKMLKMSSWALVIKLADRLDNVSDLSNLNSEFSKRYTEETNYILESIVKNRKLSKTQQKLVDKIKRKLI